MIADYRAKPALAALEAWMALLATSATPPHAQHAAEYEAASSAVAMVGFVHSELPTVKEGAQAVFVRLSTLAKP